ncbi:MAG: helix-turn-helix domain-containing protein [Candidatus Muirbacterium halophilum]|nr:helix-turn-helix domain-containing protein [Candidatus Muirbacterium halophilum]MCK9477374.1 helix-turn-helix domain-containing protein [Candidatus Muirbacterium halophilum]
MILLGEILGRKILEYRKTHKITQQELAEKANISTTYLGEIERGVKEPRIEVVERIAMALNINPTSLFSQDNSIIKNEILSFFETLDEDQLIKLYDIYKIIK